MLIFNAGLDLVLVLLWLLIVGKKRAQEAEERLLAGQELFIGRLLEQYGRCQDLKSGAKRS